MIESLPQYIEEVALKLKDIVEEIEGCRTKEDLITITSGVKDKIYSYTTEAEDKNTKTEVIKSSFKKAFNLNDKDVVIVTSDKIVVRFFGAGGTLIKKELDQSNVENILDALKKACDLNQELKSIIDLLFKNELNFEKINNFFFAENGSKLIQQKLTDLILKLNLLQDKSDIDSMCMAIFGKLEDKIYNIISFYIIEQLLQKNRKAEEFIKFYNGDTATKADGTKVKKPFIGGDEKGTGGWNPSSLLNMTKQKIQGDEALEKAKKLFDGFVKREEKLEQDLIDTDEFIKKSEVLRAEASQKEESVKLDLNDKRKELTELKRNKGDQKLINALQFQVSQLSKKEEESFNIRKTHETNIEKSNLAIKEMTKDLEAQHKVIAAEKDKLHKMIKNQEVTDAKYESAAAALAVTLSKFKG